MNYTWISRHMNIYIYIYIYIYLHCFIYGGREQVITNMLICVQLAPLSTWAVSREPWSVSCEPWACDPVSPWACEPWARAPVSPWVREPVSPGAQEPVNPWAREPRGPRSPLSDTISYIYTYIYQYTYAVPHVLARGSGPQMLSSITSFNIKRNGNGRKPPKPRFD